MARALRAAMRGVGFLVFALYLVTDGTLAAYPERTVGIFWGALSLWGATGLLRSLLRGEGARISWTAVRRYVTAGLAFSLFLLHLPQLRDILFAAFPGLERLPWATPAGADRLWEYWQVSLLATAVLRALFLCVRDRIPRPASRWGPPRF